MISEQAEDWKGEHLIKAQRNPHSGAGMNMKNLSKLGRSKAQQSMVVKCVSDGLTVREISKEIGVPMKTIRGYLKVLGLKAKKAKNLGRRGVQ